MCLVSAVVRVWVLGFRVFGWPHCILLRASRSFIGSVIMSSGPPALFGLSVSIASFSLRGWIPPLPVVISRGLGFQCSVAKYVAQSFGKDAKRDPLASPRLMNPGIRCVSSFWWLASSVSALWRSLVVLVCIPFGPFWLGVGIEWWVVCFVPGAHVLRLRLGVITMLWWYLLGMVSWCLVVSRLLSLGLSLLWVFCDVSHEKGVLA